MTQQLSLLDAQTIGAPYQPSSDTSIAAAVAARPKISPQKRRILDAMKAIGGAWIFDDRDFKDALKGPEWGWTQDEMSELCALPRSTVCARFNELERDGLIKKTAGTRRTRYKRQAAVYVLVSQGTTDSGYPARSQATGA